MNVPLVPVKDTKAIDGELEQLAERLGMTKKADALVI